MEILKAIRKGDHNKVEKILKKGYYTKINDPITDVQEKMTIKTLPLSLAVARGELVIVKLLLDYGADIHAWNNDWAPPIHLATYREHVDIIRVLLRHDVDLNSTDEIGNTPLHIAAQNLNFEIMKLFLDADCDLSITNSLNKTALDVAKEIHGDNAKEICSIIELKMRKRIPALTAADSKNKSGKSAFKNELETKLQIRELSEEMKRKTIELTETEKEIDQVLASRVLLQKHIRTLEEKVNGQTRILKEKETYKRKLMKDIEVINSKLDRPKSPLPIHQKMEDKSYECPICLEIPFPPRKVYQCKNGHIYCSQCHEKPGMNNCPQCRVPLNSESPIRNIALADIIDNLYELNH